MAQRKGKKEAEYVNKWAGLNGRHHRFVDLGRAAIFLIPLRLLSKQIKGKSVASFIEEFLVNNFDAYTMHTIPGRGVWKNKDRMIVMDESRWYEVSFVGKEKIPLLAGMLARIARATGEECFYIKAGQYTGLVYPR